MSKDLERISQVQNFRHGWRLFQAPTPQGFRESRHSCVKLWTRFRSPERYNFRLAFRRRMFNAKVKTTSAQRIANAAFFIRSKHNEWNTACLNGAQFRDTEPPHAQKL